MALHYTVEKTTGYLQKTPRSIKKWLVQTVKAECQRSHKETEVNRRGHKAQTSPEVPAVTE